MLDVELQRLHTAVLVDDRRIHGAYARRQRFGTLKADAVHGEHATFQLHPEMLFPDNALSRNLELVAEARRRETLTPDARAEHGGRFEIEPGEVESAVGFNDAHQVGGSEERAGGS